MTRFSITWQHDSFAETKKCAAVARDNMGRVSSEIVETSLIGSGYYFEDRTV